MSAPDALDANLLDIANVEVQQFTEVDAAFAFVSDAQNGYAILVDESVFSKQRKRLETNCKFGPFGVINLKGKPNRLSAPTSTFLHTPVFVNAENPALFIRKSIIHTRLSNRGLSIKVLEGASEFVDYFSLRHEVWREMGYIASDYAPPWELDYVDIHALPFGAFLDNHLVGCVRLVRLHGQAGTKETLNNIVEELDDESRQQVSMRMLNPHKFKHPFINLRRFEEFDEYYHSISKDSKAEVSRLIVKSQTRNIGIGETLLDSVVSAARHKRIEVLFLACQAKHEQFYRRSFFETLDWPKTSGFFDLPDVEAIAMEQKIKFKKSETKKASNVRR
ncbi:hypothetical protein Enr10x_04100 [Gimesia panareensis]|uniref:N-acetyltransferase domain-containing protein n=2 Tax=Gimesia panareensis TaxID=2527978 RepID=A0A517Q0J5_9PLAN|nr:hypothetical protein Enr10x_04100 [Gimesia panareensis]